MTTNTVSASILLATTLLCSTSVAAQQKASAVGQRPEKKPTLEIASVPAPQGFSVVLVLGEMQGTGAAEGVPAAARKALADMKDFLPYKGYRLLDTQWTLCCGSSTTVTRLRGPEEQDYILELNPSLAGVNGRWHVRFALREPSGAESGGEGALGPRESANLAAQKRDVENRLRALRERYSENHPETQLMRAQIAELEVQAARQREAEKTTARMVQSVRLSTRALIDTSFTMDIGETVVVGTSRIKGDKALIALLTAVPSMKGNTR
jgi:hypothetical protein